jgi:hypothetical protein
MLSLATIIVAKCAMLGLLLRITPQRDHRIVIWALLILTCVVGLAWGGIFGARCAATVPPWQVIMRQCHGYVSTFNNERLSIG